MGNLQQGLREDSPPLGCFRISKMKIYLLISLLICYQMKQIAAGPRHTITVRTSECIPNSQDACKAAALASNPPLALGGKGYAFAGDYGTRGCFAYSRGDYKGMTFFGTGEGDAWIPQSAGSELAQSEKKDGKYRPKGYDCDGNGENGGSALIQNGFGKVLTALKSFDKKLNNLVYLPSICTYVCRALYGAEGCNGECD